MKKKNILTAAVSLSLVACLSIGATLAYFTDKTDTASNVFTTGKVGLTLIDQTNDEKGQYTFDENGVQDGIQYTGVMPGDTLNKVVGVTPNYDSADCYVAVRVAVSGPEEETGYSKWTDLAEQVAATAKEKGWYTTEAKLVGDEAVVDCYYSGVATPNQYVSLFDEVNIPTTWGNDVAGITFTMDVSAAAIQAEHLEAPNAALDNTAYNELSNMLQQVALG